MISQKIFKNSDTGELLKLTIENYNLFSIEFQDRKVYLTLEEYMQYNSYFFSLDNVELIEINEV